MKTIPCVSGFYFVELKYFTSLTELPYSASPANYMIVRKPRSMQSENLYPEDCYFEAYGEKFPILAIGKSPNGIGCMLEGGFDLKSFPTITNGLCELKDFDRNHPQEWADENLIVLYRITAASDCRYNYYQLCDKYSAICGLYDGTYNVDRVKSMTNKTSNTSIDHNYASNITYSYGQEHYTTNRKTTLGKIVEENQSDCRSMGTTILYCYENYFIFSGRASRYEYWTFAIFWGIIGVLANIFIGILENSPSIGSGINILWGLLLLVNIFNIIPSWAVSWRRMHDIGKSGWFSLLPTVIVIIWAITLVIYMKTDNDGWTILTPNRIEYNYGKITEFLVFLFSGPIISLVIYIYFFTKRGDATTNRYGAPTI